MNIYVAEFIGTYILILLGVGVVAGVSLKKTYSNSAGWVVITFAWGLAVLAGVHVSGSFSGAHLNPAVTLGLAVVGDFAMSKVLGYIIAQILGAFFAACTIYLYYLPHWRVTEGDKIGIFATGPAIKNNFSNFFGEYVGTFILLFVIMAIGGANYSAGIGPLAVGLLVVVIGMSLGGTTGYAINPARDFGPRLAFLFLPIPNKGGSNFCYAWVPILSPLLGGSMGALTYKVLTGSDMGTMFYIFLGLSLFAFGLCWAKTKPSL